MRIHHTHDYWTKLMMILETKEKVFYQLEPIKSLINHRLTYYQNKINMIASSETSWKMPEAIFPDHLVIERFLHSNERTLKFSLGYGGLPKARKFAMNNSRTTMTYSIKCEPGNAIGKNAFILINKTRDYFDNLKSEKALYQNQANNIRRLLQ
jgi:hypothetical protein